mmetsp:Transcript_5320/g.10923  ORF Transcript_5320/g.10923 Transcript_5320/m.10923 type:complete len:562 (-) Transcript_5320:1568-3253(-)
MHTERDEHGNDEVGIAPRRHGHKTSILGKGIQGVEHLNGHQYGQGQGRGLDFPVCEVFARIRLHIESIEVVDFEVGPSTALTPVGELLPRDIGVVSWMEDVPIRKDSHACETDVDSDDHVAEEYPRSNETVVRTTREFFHDIRVRGIESQSRGGRSVRDEIDPQQLHGNQSLGKAQCRRKENGRHLSDVGRDEVPNEGLHIIVNRTSLLHGVDDRRKVIVGENHIGSFFCHFRPGQPHGDTDIRLFQGRSVVDAISRHGHDTSLRLEKFDQLLFVFGLRPGKDQSSVPPHQKSQLFRLALLKEIGTRKTRLRIESLIQNPNVHGDRLGSQFVISRDHHDPNSGHLAHLHHGRDFLARRVDDPDQAHEGQIALYLFERARIPRQNLRGGVSAAPVVRGEGTREVFAGQGEDAEGPSGHACLLGDDGVFGGGVEGDDGSVSEHEFGASRQESFGSSLDEELVGAPGGGFGDDGHGFAIASEFESGEDGGFRGPVVVDGVGGGGGVGGSFGQEGFVGRSIGKADLLHQDFQTCLGRFSDANVFVVLGIVLDRGGIAQGSHARRH